MNPKRLFIVTTFAGNNPYILWQECKMRYQEWQHDEDLKNKCVYLFKTGETAISFLIDKESSLIIMHQDQSIIAALKAFSDKVDDLKTYDIYIAHHQANLDETTKRFLLQYRLIESTYFPHDSKNPIYNALFSKSPTGDIIGLVVEINRDNFDHLLESFKKKLIIRFSAIKHRLSHIFLPIDIDLQGLADSGYNKQYQDEIIQVYNGKIKELLGQARDLVYGGKTTKDNIMSIVKDAKDSIHNEENDNKMNEQLEILQKLLPKQKKNGRTSFKIANEVLFWLQNEKGINNIRISMEKGNSFHDWFRTLDESLDSLRKYIPQ
ncbi:hypothetical protein JXB12_12140 [candidate division KSB1 bacterium]|nr:hypothetical protein [candidate division KSB1 bacterium]